MKLRFKYIVVVLLLLFTSGCHNIKNESIDDIINKISNKSKRDNVFRSGYKFYLPKQLSIKNYLECNDVIESGDNTYYLYVDLIGYYNKKAIDYQINSDAYYSKKISYNNMNGYVEINLKENDQYLIEIMFNYAKIEVMVDSASINIALNYAVSILGSITYNNNVIENLYGEDASSFPEEIYNVFEIKGNDDDYLHKVEEESDDNQEVKDTDFVN